MNRLTFLFCNLQILFLYKIVEIKVVILIDYSISIINFISLTYYLVVCDKIFCEIIALKKLSYKQKKIQKVKKFSVIVVDKHVVS